MGLNQVYSFEGSHSESGPRFPILIEAQGKGEVPNHAPFPVPTPADWPHFGLVDTGTFQTVVDEQILVDLQIRPHSVISITCVGLDEPRLCNVYKAQISLPAFGPPMELEVVGMDLFKDIQCLMGLDLLLKMELFARGEDNHFELKRYL